MEGSIHIVLTPQKDVTECAISVDVHWGSLSFEEVTGIKISVIKALLQAFDFTIFELALLYNSIENNSWPDGELLKVGEGLIPGDRDALFYGNYSPDKVSKNNKEVN